MIKMLEATGWQGYFIVIMIFALGFFFGRVFK